MSHTLLKDVYIKHFCECLCVCICTMCVAHTHWDQKKVSDPMKVESLFVVMTCHLDAEKQT